MKHTLMATALMAAAALVTPVMAQANVGVSQQTGVSVGSGENLSTAEIMRVQQALANKGEYRGRVDGLWGPMTERALRDFQSSNNLDVTGELSQDTQTQLGVQVGSIDASMANPQLGTPEGAQESETYSNGAGSGATDATSVDRGSDSMQDMEGGNRIHDGYND